MERQLALVRRVLGADDEGGDAKVGDLDLARLLVPDDVVWLDVLVDDGTTVDATQCARHGHGQRQEATQVAGEGAVTGEPLVERFAAKVLDDEGLDAGPRQPRQDAHHAGHAAQALGHHLVLVLEVAQVARQRQRHVEHLHSHQLPLSQPSLLLSSVFIFTVRRSTG